MKKQSYALEQNEFDFLCTDTWLILVLWIKAFHIIGFTAWFAGIFYIWRLFVYHADTNSQDVREQLAIMERKLYKFIMRPAMVITLACGLILFYFQWNVISRSIWIWIKVGLVLFVLGNHFLADYYRKQLLLGVRYNGRRFRFLNEVPTILLICIVLLAVLKPF